LKNNRKIILALFCLSLFIAPFFSPQAFAYLTCDPDVTDDCNAGVSHCQNFGGDLWYCVCNAGGQCFYPDSVPDEDGMPGNGCSEPKTYCGWDCRCYCPPSSGCFSSRCTGGGGTCDENCECSYPCGGPLGCAPPRVANLETCACDCPSGSGCLSSECDGSCDDDCNCAIVETECPDGKIWNEATQKCACIPIDCIYPKNQNLENCQCVVECEDGKKFNEQTHGCECIPIDCEEGETQHPQTCECFNPDEPRQLFDEGCCGSANTISAGDSCPQGCASIGIDTCDEIEEQDDGTKQILNADVSVSCCQCCPSNTFSSSCASLGIPELTGCQKQDPESGCYHCTAPKWDCCGDNETMADSCSEGCKGEEKTCPVICESGYTNVSGIASKEVNCCPCKNGTAVTATAECSEATSCIDGAEDYCHVDIATCQYVKKDCKDRSEKV